MYIIKVNFMNIIKINFMDPNLLINTFEINKNSILNLTFIDDNLKKNIQINYLFFDFYQLSLAPIACNR